MKRIPITIIPGDGIGPEIMDMTISVLKAVNAPLEYEVFEAGGNSFKKGIASGVPQETIDSIKRTRLVLKGPLETPVGFGEKSANVTLRKLFETFANIRPIREFAGVETPYKSRGIDLVVVRENVEDLYAGIEHMQTADVAQCLKLITRKGSEKAIRTAFELARSEGRKSVHCATKANIMKMTEGMFKRVFEEVSKEYPEIQAHHIIVDNCAHQLVKKPEQFEVIVTTNMNGDILSDLTSALVGGLGFAPSANVGKDIAIFEAVHWSAPKYAGKDTINPAAVMLSSVMMLRYLKLEDQALQIENAIRLTLEDGIATKDVLDPINAVGTKEFTSAVIRNLGKSPKNYPARKSQLVDMSKVVLSPEKTKTLFTDGADVFIEFKGTQYDLGPMLESIAAGTAVKLKMISNRGTKVYPGTSETDCVDHWRCRFVNRNGKEISDRQIYDLLWRVTEKGLKWMHIEKLQLIDSVPGWTKAQGED
ncbi:MAG: NADP-dependent isocitrate dehydrogenase [Bacteriovoracaceae bacterium]|nr:NADP-dependent isocitrate dehydrogenase [Bacteriovoracaceae bacterium]